MYKIQESGGVYSNWQNPQSVSDPSTMNQFSSFLNFAQNNIAMALELTYRERLHRVYKEVKNRLDYQISVQNMMRRKEQEHMVNWVEKHVVQSLSTQQVHDILKLLELY